MKLPPIPNKNVTLPPLPNKSVTVKSPSRNLPPVAEAVANITQSMKAFQKTSRKGLSGIKDVDLKILSELNDRDLFSFCIADKHVNQMCKDENFWRNRFFSRFGKVENPKTSWRKYYLRVISDLDRYSSNPWNFFNELSWMIGKTPNKIRSDVNNLDFILSFKFLELGKNITLYFQRDRYEDVTVMKRVYKNEKDFSPEEILNLVYNFYQEPITEQEYEEMQAAEVHGIDDISEEDVENKKVKRIDLMFGLQFFEGFTKYEDGYLLNLGS